MLLVWVVWCYTFQVGCLVLDLCFEVFWVIAVSVVFFSGGLVSSCGLFLLCVW